MPNGDFIDGPDPMNLLPAGPQAGNAWRHGLRARRVIVREEEHADFERLREALVEEWRPANVTAWLLIDHLARLQWRLSRAGEAEAEKLDGLQISPNVAGHCVSRDGGASPAAALAWDLSRPASSLQRIQVYQMRIERAVHRSIALLIALRKSRGKRGGLPRSSGRQKPPQPLAGPSDAGRDDFDNGTIKSDPNRRA